MADVTIVDVDATWVNPTTVSYDAGELRRADAAMYVAAGVVRDSATALAVSVDGSDVVTVKAGGWVIPGNAVAGSGVWRGGIAVDVTANLAARDATYGRIDLVVARQLDTDVVATHGAYTGRLQILTGTPSASPAVPVLPSMAVELGRITVPASGGAPASVDSSHRTYATAAGGEIVVPSSAMLPTGVSAGQQAWTLDTGTSYRWDGTAWDDGTWKTYTPALTGTGITKGNGTLSGRYRQNGKTVFFSLTFTRGGTTSGTGPIIFTLPVAARSTLAAIGQAVCQQSPFYLSGIAAIDGTATQCQVQSPANGRWTESSLPSSGSSLVIAGSYEAA